MPENFDTIDADLSFQAGGTTYTMQLASYEVLAKHDDLNDGEPPESNLIAGQRLRDRMVDYLIEGDREPFAKACDDGTIPFAKLQAILIWANGIQTGRPTTPPESSVSGPGGTAPTSSGSSVRASRVPPRTRTPARR